MTETIGRFNIVRELGKGAQGTVYLAQDTHLERQVAIKTLHATKGKNTQALLKEARIVSQLQHPNIVTLFDADENKGAPYLVYAYVEGQTLAQILKKEKTLSLTRAAQITCGILDGISCAHRHGVLHLDIKPANIMLSAEGQPQVMDFGIARSMKEKAANKTINGTPHYMAPEIIAGKESSIGSDLFSVGMVLYELVTGAPAAHGDNVKAVLHQNAHEAATPPSSQNPKVDPQLEGIILKALAKIPDERYANAEAMKAALLRYLDPAGDDVKKVEPDKSSSLEFLLRRMRSKSDFPALSNTITEINKVVSNENESSNKLTKAILQDFALTNKLLKLVNTVSYTQFGGNINTISKAVVILGFDTVRDIAMSLILLDFMQNKSQAAQLRDDVVGSFFAGMVSANLATGHGMRNAEEAMICGMFHNLGRLLVTFYLFEESQQVERLVEQGLTESQAALKVLGITYNDLAIGVAKSWSFPNRLIAGMQKIGPGKVKKPRGDVEQLTAAANLANELCTMAASTPTENREKALKQLSKRYEDAIKVSDQQLGNALDSGLAEVSKRAFIFNMPIAKNPVLKKIVQWNGASGKIAPGNPTQQDALTGFTRLDTLVEAQAEARTEAISATRSDASPGAKAEAHAEAGADAIAATDALPASRQERPVDEHQMIDAETILSAGIQDVTNTLVEDYNLNDILQMVLETMYRGMGFNRIMIFVRDAQNNQMAARFGFGRNIDALLPKFRFPLAFAPDVFHVALNERVDIVIEDVTAGNISSKIPEWHKNSVTAQSFLLLPISINTKVVGLFYADMEKANALHISQRQLSMLRTLRNQAVLAIKQKQ